MSRRVNGCGEHALRYSGDRTSRSLTFVPWSARRIVSLSGGGRPRRGCCLWRQRPLFRRNTRCGVHGQRATQVARQRRDAVMALGGESVSAAVPDDDDDDDDDASRDALGLDAKLRSSLLTRVAAAVVGMVAAVIAYQGGRRVTAPVHPSPGGGTPPASLPSGWRVLRSGVLGAAAFLAVRWIAYNRAYTQQLQHPEQLADADSQFVDAAGIRVHVKACAPRDTAAAASLRKTLLLLHGFGTWLFSFRNVQQPLADRWQARVVSFDRPAFGLTERPRFVEAYTTEYSAKLTNELLERFSATSDDGDDDGFRCLIGHSLGALIAVRAALMRATPPQAVVLVAPAILAAPPPLRAQTSIGRLLRGLLLPFRVATATLLVLLRRAVFFALEFTATLSIYSLRAIVGRSRFWTTGLQSAWHDPRRITDEVVRGYRRPSRAVDWDLGFLRFLRARFASPPGVAGLVGQVREVATGASAFASANLVAALRQSGVPVLIVHGDQDRLVPLSNSERLARMLGCRLAVIRDCGHVPHEERPEEFMQAVLPFLDACDASARVVAC
eukprot:ctg_510.g306